MPGVLSFLHGQLLQTVALPTKPLTGTTFVVTGANSGLGLEACKHLLRLQCGTIIMAVRNVEKGEAARQEVLAAAPTNNTTPTKTNLEIWPLDLTSYSSVTAFADRAATLPRLDAAILNAGVSLTEFSTAESLETTITVNVTSTFLLALLLLPTLRKSATAYNILPHIAIVGSAVHFWANTKSLTSVPAGQNILKTLSQKDTAVMKERYFLSKLLVMVCVRHLATLLTASSTGSNAKPLVIVNNVAPGLCVTALFRHEETAASRAALKVVGRSSEEGSRTLVHGAIAGRESHGAYLSEGMVKKASAWVRSKEGEAVEKRVWSEVVGVAEGVRAGVGEYI